MMPGRQVDTSWPGREAAGQSDGRARTRAMQRQDEGDGKTRAASQEQTGQSDGRARTRARNVRTRAAQRQNDRQVHREGRPPGDDLMAAASQEQTLG